jgi:glycosyltransferase involved in cell wall biosynthesis
MRLHSIILAARAGVPVVALAYSRKVRSVMRRLGCEDLTLDLNQITPAALTGLLKEVSARGEAWAARVSGKAEDLSRRAGRDCHLVREVLAGERARRPHLSTATLTLFKEVALGLALGAEEKRRVATELVAQRDGLEAERDRLRVLCEELARQHGDHLGQLEAWIDASVSGRSALQEQVRNLERDQRHLSEESALRAARIEELLARVSDMSDERAALVERTRRLERRSQRLREERRRLREESTGHVDRIAELIADRQQLNSERDRARADWQQLAAEKDLMSRALAELTDTRGFRLLQGYWRLRKRLAEAAKLPRSMKPWALSERRRRGGHALVFDRYKRLRKASCGADLSGVVAPGEPGLVSILLLACHNAELTREALDSLLSQSYERFELLALQDRPTSELKTLLRDYAARDPRIRIVDREHPDLPPSFWRGTDRARGELWTWLREGCRPRPDFLERMVACLERHPAWDVAYAEVGRVHERDEGVGFLARSRVAWLQGCEPPCSAAAEHDYWMEIRELFAVRRVDFADVVPERRTGSRPSTALHGEPEMSRSGAERLVFDDFRRDFCLSPMIWWLEDDAGKRSQALRRRLERRIAGAAHQLWNVNARDPSRLPRLWLPLVYVRLAEGAAAAAPVPKGLPGSALRVLVSGAQQQPETGQAAWDLCVTAANGASPPAPEGGRDWLRIRGPRQLFAALDIRARSHSTALLAAELREPRAPELAVSVIICTYRRSERLAKAIESVARQSLPRSSYEVVIVVNGPQDSELRAKIDELRQQHFADHPHNFRPILCPILGLSHARNAGISEARGKILSFLDDDAIASADWLERVCEAFDRFPRAGVVGGHIILTPPEPRPWVLSDGWERYWSHFVTGHREATTVQHWWEFPWGANWSARRQALLEIGGFRCRYGRRGNDFSGGEEIVAASLIQRLGYEIAVAPAATVLHDVEPSRYSFRHVRRTIIAGTMVNYQCQRDLYIPMGATVRDTLRRLISFDVDRTVSANSSLVRVRHWLYRKEALSRLLLAQLRTYLARLLGPVVEKG